MWYQRGVTICASYATSGNFSGCAGIRAGSWRPRILVQLHATECASQAHRHHLHVIRCVAHASRLLGYYACNWLLWPALFSRRLISLTPCTLADNRVKMAKAVQPITKKRNAQKRSKGFARFQSDQFLRMGVSIRAVGREAPSSAALLVPTQQHASHLVTARGTLAHSYTSSLGLFALNLRRINPWLLVLGRRERPRRSCGVAVLAPALRG